MASQKDIVAAIAILDLGEPDGLSRKPTVSDLSSMVGDKVSAAERDDAWHVFINDRPVDVFINADPVDENMVSNNHRSPICVSGVVIQPGRSKLVPDLDLDNNVIKIWLEKEVISIG